MNDGHRQKNGTWTLRLSSASSCSSPSSVGGISVVVIVRSEHHHRHDRRQANTDEEFDAIRAKFAGQQPLIQMIDGSRAVRRRYDASTATTTLKTMHVIACDR